MMRFRCPRATPPGLHAGLRNDTTWDSERLPRICVHRTAYLKALQFCFVKLSGLRSQGFCILQGAHRVALHPSGELHSWLQIYTVFFSAMDRSQEGGTRSVLLRQMLSAGIAGTLADGITYPMMTVKSRMMVQGAASAGSSSGGGALLYMYKGPMNAIYTIATQEGWRTLYKGYATLTQVATAQALYMATYQTTKRVVPGGQDSPVVQFGGGIAATLVQSLINVPVEIIRQRQMVQTAGEGSYKGSIDTARTVYRQEGFGAMYRGFLLAQMVWGPYNAIYLPLWEYTKRVAANYSEVESVEKLDVRYELASSFFSASIAAALTNPMDVIKTRLQVQGKSNVSSSTQYNGAMDAAAAIWKKEGFKGFTCGITSRMFWVAPSSMIMFTTYDQIFKRLNRS